MFDVNMLLTSFGLIGILGIIFMETGVFFGFFFPGPSPFFPGGNPGPPHPAVHAFMDTARRNSHCRRAWRSTWILHRTHRRPPDDGQSCHALDRS